MSLADFCISSLFTLKCTVRLIGIKSILHSSFQCQVNNLWGYMNVSVTYTKKQLQNATSNMNLTPYLDILFSFFGGILKLRVFGWNNQKRNHSIIKCMDLDIPDFLMNHIQASLLFALKKILYKEVSRHLPTHFDAPPTIFVLLWMHFFLQWFLMQQQSCKSML